MEPARSPKVSVIVVSRHRPDALQRCLKGLEQLDHIGFELVVVCDPASAEVIAGRPDAPRVKLWEFDEANVSAARNIGIAAAAGEIVAFIDDDAVPEPTWLDRLIAPFSDPEVVATGGFVRGRNGVSFQWQASQTDHTGRRYDVSPTAALPPGRVWRTEGTNMAFRKAGLTAIGGFDEAFAFYLDETDVNLRLSGRIVIVPEAEVHHGFLASARRRSDRVPRDLFEIGASVGYFLTKHAPDLRAEIVAQNRGSERRRLLRHMVAGRLEPRDVRLLLQSFDAGCLEGQTRRAQLGLFSEDVLEERTDFLPFRREPAGPQTLVTGPWSARNHLKQNALEAACAGERPTLILFAPDARYLQVRYASEGVWMHVGGQFGRGLRDEPLWRWARRRDRVAEELRRTATIRGLPSDVIPSHKP